VKRSTLNFQRGDRKGVLWPGYGDRHGIWAPKPAGRADMGTDTEFGRSNLLARRTCPMAGRAVEAGCGTEIWEQTRCPI